MLRYHFARNNKINVSKKWVTNLKVGANVVSIIELLLSVKAVLLDFSLSVKAAPHECVIRTSQL